MKRSEEAAAFNYGAEVQMNGLSNDARQSFFKAHKQNIVETNV